MLPGKSSPERNSLRGPLLARSRAQCTPALQGAHGRGWGWGGCATAPGGTASRGEPHCWRRAAAGVACGPATRSLHAKIWSACSTAAVEAIVPEGCQISSCCIAQVSRLQPGGIKGVGCRRQAGSSAGGVGKRGTRGEACKRLAVLPERGGARHAAAPDVRNDRQRPLGWPATQQRGGGSPLLRPTLPLLCGRQAISCTVTPLGHLSPLACEGDPVRRESKV